MYAGHPKHHQDAPQNIPCTARAPKTPHTPNTPRGLHRARFARDVPGPLPRRRRGVLAGTAPRPSVPDTFLLLASFLVLLLG